ncbi:MAG: T9SS type A sorting domain-containing protein [bacterium]
MKTAKLFFLIAFLLLSAGTNLYLLSQETQSDTAWVHWTHDITRLEFSNDDSKILTVGSGGIIIFDTPTGVQLKQLPGYLDAEYSTDNSLIFAVRETPDSVNNIFPYIDVIETSAYEKINTIKLPKIFWEGMSRIAVSPDIQTIALVNENVLYLVDYPTGEIKKTLFSYESQEQISVKYFLFSKDSQHLIFTGSDGKLRFLNVLTYQIDFKYDSGYGYLIQSEDGSIIAFKTGISGSAVSIMNTQTHEIINSIPGNAGDVCGMAFSPDGQYLAVSWLSKLNIEIYKIIDLIIFYSLIFIINGNSCCFPPMAITNNNDFLVGGGGPGIVLFNLKTTGIIEPGEIIDILYPNPTNNTLILNFNLPIPAQLGYNLYDITGNQISNLKSAFYNPGQIIENFSLGNLVNGSYFLKVESLQFNKTFKIIINN